MTAAAHRPEPAVAGSFGAEHTVRPPGCCQPEFAGEAVVDEIARAPHRRGRLAREPRPADIAMVGEVPDTIRAVDQQIE
jgi:hypothetical protein